MTLPEHVSRMVDLRAIVRNVNTVVRRTYSALGVVSPGVAPSNPSPTVIVAVYLAGWPWRRVGRCAQLGFRTLRAA
jgi:hypothetical protein